MFGKDDHAWLEELRRAHYPFDRNRVPVHLTLFAQLPPHIERELGGRLGGYSALPAPRALLAGIMDLGGGTGFRVDSEELEQIRADLADGLHGLLGAQDRAPWSPHVTIQNKVEPRAAKALQAELRAKFEPRPLAIKGLASWRYMDGPWEPIRQYSFRG